MAAAASRADGAGSLCARPRAFLALLVSRVRVHAPDLRGIALGGLVLSRRVVAFRHVNAGGRSCFVGCPNAVAGPQAGGRALNLAVVTVVTSAEGSAPGSWRETLHGLVSSVLVTLNHDAETGIHV